MFCRQSHKDFTAEVALDDGRTEDFLMMVGMKGRGFSTQKSEEDGDLVRGENENGGTCK